MSSKTGLCAFVASLTLGAAVALGPVAPAGSGAQAQELDWATGAGGGTGLDRGRGIATHPRGDAYVTGSFNGAATFGAGEANETTLTAAGSFDVFVAKYRP